MVTSLPLGPHFNFFPWAALCGVFLAELLSHSCDPYPKMKAIGDVKTFVLEEKENGKTR